MVGREHAAEDREDAVEGCVREGQRLGVPLDVVDLEQLRRGAEPRALEQRGNVVDADGRHPRRAEASAALPLPVATLDTRPGRVRERIAEVQREWFALLESLLEEAVRAGELAPGVDPAQAAFEVNAMLSAANGTYLLQGSPEVFERARQAIRGCLPRAA